MIKDKQVATAHQKKADPDGGNGTLEAEKISEQEEKFFKLFGIILVLVVFYLPFLSSFITGALPQTISPFYY